MALPVTLYHPDPNATVLKVYREDKAETGGDFFNDQETAPLVGDATPYRTESFNGKAGAFVKRYSRLQTSGDAGSAYIEFRRLTVPQAVGPVAQGDTIQVTLETDGLTYTWAVAAVDYLDGDPACPLYRITTREE